MRSKVGSKALVKAMPIRLSETVPANDVISCYRPPAWPLRWSLLKPYAHVTTESFTILQQMLFFLGIPKVPSGWGLGRGYRESLG